MSVKNRTCIFVAANKIDLINPQFSYQGLQYREKFGTQSWEQRDQ